MAVAVATVAMTMRMMVMLEVMMVSARGVEVKPYFARLLQREQGITRRNIRILMIVSRIVQQSRMGYDIADMFANY